MNGPHFHSSKYLGVDADTQLQIKWTNMGVFRFFTKKAYSSLQKNGSAELLLVPHHLVRQCPDG